MKTRIGLVPLTLALVALAVSVPGSPPLAGQEKAPEKGRAWTLDEALEQLRLYPRDAYLQYVALQLARRERRADEVAGRINTLLGRDEMAKRREERVGRVDLFSLFSGALAVQESLQLDTMRGRRTRPAKPAGTGDDASAVGVAGLAGPTVKSHPWAKMLAGRKPDVGRLARCVPDDFYLIEFRSLVKLLEVMDQSDLWGTHLFSQAAQEARTHLVGDRLKRQLAVETTKVLRPFYDAVVGEVAVTGSDLFLREGSDVTLLFRVKQPEVFKARMNGFLSNAEKANPDARRTEGEHLGVKYVRVATPDRGVHVYSAYPAPDLHVRSNSLVGLRRVIDATVGKGADGKAVRRLGDTEEFAYIRTLLPRGAKEEDGLVYLSDPFIRRLVGPEVKLTERRRLLCYNHLRMIAHAGLLYRTERGKAPASLAELVKADCAPGEFGKGDLVCPDGGKYSLSADGLTGACSHHGHAHALTPCCEVPVKEVSREEAREYKAFLDEYNQYWRTYFDPIALRIQIAPKSYRIETVVLPLIDNSIYTALARTLGGKPEPLDALPVPNRNIFSVAVRLDKRELLDSLGMGGLLGDAGKEEKPGKDRPDADTQQMAQRLKQLGLAMHNYLSAYSYFPTAVSFDKEGKKTGLSWRVHLLLFLDEDGLYKQFKLDEPWDSPHNKKLVAKMPAIYRPADPKLAAAGKTRIVGPLGDEVLFPKSNKKVSIAQITDGLSNTIMQVEADDGHAVVWTKPDDLEIDLKKPLSGLAIRPPGAFLVLLADGSVHFLRDTTPTKTVAALFTRNGGEVIEELSRHEIALRLGRERGSVPDFLVRVKAGELLAKGVGNQVGLHVYDAEPMFDFSLPGALGLALGSFNDRRLFGGPEAVLIPAVITSLNSPVYLSVPVKDPKVVDEFLTRLDDFLAVVAREKIGFEGPLRISQDFYRFANPRGKNLRGYAFRFGPLKWRLFWGRIGDGLYVASKPFILEDLLVATDRAGPGAPDRGPAAHAMVRLRPRNWNRVLDDYRLGWAECNREACLHNLGPLSSLSRALPAGKSGKPAGDLGRELRRLSARLYGVHFFCPDGGRYAVSPDGKAVTCPVHGSALAPKQPVAPSEKSGPGRLLLELADMTLALTFLEDGLHAVVTIERK
jgi:hypothetical protein